MIPILIAGGTKSERDAKLDDYLADKKVLDQLDGAGESLKIEPLRQLLSHLSFSFRPEDNVALVIRESQALTHVAQNALLKSLEEIPEAFSFYLTAERQTSLLATVVSRCQVINLEAKLLVTTPQDEAEFIALFKLIGSGKIGQLIKTAEAWVKTEPQVKIEKLASFLVAKSRHNPQPKRAAAIRAVLECAADLRGSVNKQLALEHAFFTLANLSQNP